jgi:uroporphyrin-III C-methyltransferase
MEKIVAGLRRTRPRATGVRRQPGGTVSLVGAGPGDPGLLTLKGVQRLWEADVVYHDALVSQEILDFCGPNTQRVAVGKRRGRVRVPQAEIEAALVRDARSGLAVVRLKGGDPFVFGRGSEEILTLLGHGIPFEVIPGISSGTAVPALAGIPLTHRGISGSAAFVTAHDLGPGAEGEAVRQRLGHLARGVETLVVFMAGAELERVSATLTGAGLPPDTPAALIENGTLPQERFVITTLQDLGKAGQGRGAGPVLLVIGKTVLLSTRLRSGSATRPDIAQPVQEIPITSWPEVVARTQRRT